MIALAVKHHDFSRLPDPLTWKEIVWLEVFGKDENSAERLVIEDIRWLLLNSEVTACISEQQLKFMPSGLNKLAENFKKMKNL